jgi:hypothetical protein
VVPVLERKVDMKIYSSLLAPFVGAVLFLTVTPAHGTTLYGNTVTYQCLPNVEVECYPNTVMDDGSSAITIDVDNNPSFSALVGANDVLFTATASEDFGGDITITVRDVTQPFTGASLLSTTTTFSPGDLSFSGGAVTVALSNISFSNGDTIDAGLTTDTPEPSTIGLVAVASIALGLAFVAQSRVALAKRVHCY